VIELKTEFEPLTPFPEPPAPTVTVRDVFAATGKEP
jgi:hypothetical protein